MTKAFSHQMHPQTDSRPHDRMHRFPTLHQVKQGRYLQVVTRGGSGLRVLVCMQAFSGCCRRLLPQPRALPCIIRAAPQSSLRPVKGSLQSGRVPGASCWRCWLHWRGLAGPVYAVAGRRTNKERTGINLPGARCCSSAVPQLGRSRWWWLLGRGRGR